MTETLRIAIYGFQNFTRSDGGLIGLREKDFESQIDCFIEMGNLDLN